MNARQVGLEGDLIRASWRRCLTDHRLERHFEHHVEVADTNRLTEVRQSMDELLHESAGVVSRIRRVAKDVGYVILMSSAEGLVFESFADSVLGEEIQSEGLRKGTMWCENMVGTNGIGTALISRNPLTVHGGAHFNSVFRKYTCSAAPIFSSDGSVLAVLDLSGRANTESSDEYRFAEYFVREAASHISMLLFQKMHGSDCVVALSGEPDPMPMRSRALVAVAEDGTIRGATPEAFAMIGVPELSDLGQKSIRDLWDVTIDDLKPLSTHNTPLKLGDGSAAYATAFLPEVRHIKSVNSKTVRRKTISIPSLSSSKLRPLDRVAGGDSKLREIVKLCRKIVDKDLPVMVLGETGVGKDTIARAMHDESVRSKRPYVAVNCAAIPATLLASELFGYAPGSFTGASRNGRVGKIQASDSGTLFLDEIGDMPLDLQAHLLRVLEERTVTPLGSTDAIPVDLRIICATHRELPSLVQQGRFRRDLYFRLKGVQIELPSLRDRTDIHELAELIAEDEAAIADREPVQFSEEAMELLRRYSWPGNIRELRSAIRLILSVNSEQIIQAEHIPSEIAQEARAVLQSAGTPMRMNVAAPIFGAGGEVHTLAAANEAAEENLILEALRTNRWNVTDAARQLGVSRATLHRKIRKYEIVSPNNKSD